MAARGAPRLLPGGNVKVKLEIEVTDAQRTAIGRIALGTWKAAPEEGVRFWAMDVLQRELGQLTAGDADPVKPG